MIVVRSKDVKGRYVDNEDGTKQKETEQLYRRIVRPVWSWTYTAYTFGRIISVFMAMTLWTIEGTNWLLNK